MNSPDHPDLTAYALGELDAEHAEAMSRWIAENPQAGHEVDTLNELCQRLQSTAPVAVDVLHAHQRAAVMTGPVKVRKMVAAATMQAPRKRPSPFIPIAYGFSRVAAAAVLVIGGYLAGTHVAGPKGGTVASTPPAPAGSPPKPASSPVVVQPFKAREIPSVAQTQPPTAAPVLVVAKTEPAPAKEPPALAPPKMQPKVIVASVPVTVPPAAKEPARVATPKTRVLTEAFVSTTKATLAQVDLHPADTRYVAPRSNEPVAAAPLVHTSKSAEPAAHGKQPDLLIHSWKAEVASCPWNDSHRLMRLTIQIPGEQPAAAMASSYPVQVNFSPNHVRSYRQIGERTIPATAADAPAFHIVWYEFLPNGLATEGAARAIGAVTLPGARFTTAAMGPFDSSKLQVVDRGTDWNAARDDFLFESAVVGFGLLLKGEKDAGTLDHSLVLSLAKRTAAEDRTGERARFVKLVQDAQRSAGL
jgi:hypothetical protein